MKNTNVINDLQLDYQSAFKAWMNMNAGQEFNYAEVTVIEKATLPNNRSPFWTAVAVCEALKQ